MKPSKYFIELYKTIRWIFCKVTAKSFTETSVGNFSAAAALDLSAVAVRHRSSASVRDRSVCAVGFLSTASAGENSIIVCDHGSKAKAKKGTVITLVERNCLSDQVEHFVSILIDGDEYKEDVFYTLIGGVIRETK